MSHALIALGGNLGHVKTSFDTACNMLIATCHIEKKSQLYQTPAIGPLLDGQQQPDYLNAVIQVSTELTAIALLQELHRIEAAQGRERIEHWGARTLDLDLLSYDALVCKTDDLILPHPRMHERLFVLQPLADIQPDWHHPIHRLTTIAMIQAVGNTNLFKGQPWISQT